MSHQSAILSLLFILGLISLAVGRSLPEFEGAEAEPKEDGEDLDRAEFFWGGGPGPGPGPCCGPWGGPCCGPWVAPWGGPWPGPGPFPGPWGGGPWGPW